MYLYLVLRTHLDNPSSYQSAVAQVIDSSKTSEPAASTRIQYLANVVRDVIQNGLSSLPTYERKGLGHIRFVGNYDTSDMLIVTNTSKSTVIFNFTDPLKGGKITRLDDVTPRDSGGYIVKYDSTNSNENADDDFPKYLQTTDAISVLDLEFDTSSMSESDEIQIFTDTPEQVMRPTILEQMPERMRIASVVHA